MTQDFDILWERIRNHDDEKALELVYRSAFKPLVRYITHLTGSYEGAEEVFQDTFIGIWQKRNVISIKGSFKSYLFKAAHNHALNYLRHKRSVKESVNQVPPEKIWTFISETYDSEEYSIEWLYSEEIELLIEKVVAGLPGKCRNIFIMSRYSNLGNAEIAKQMDLSENTVRSHIYNALQKISEVLKKE